MTREWKPGDVAIVSDGEVEWFGLVRNRSAAARAALEFAYTTGGYDMVNDLADGFTARPLVVIDPEDREQIERLYASWLDNLAAPEREAQVNAMQAALRSLFDPPKPDEPTGLGAVVECEHQGQPGVAVRHGSGWTFTADHVTDHSVDWGDFDAVRVLSEGVAVDR